MSDKTVAKAFSYLLIGAASAVSLVCVRPAKQPARNTPPQEPPALGQVRKELGPPPRLAEAQQAVRRVFKHAAIIDPSRRPGFVTGDFNGDLSPDIAVILKPVDLAEMNSEFPPWMLKDPFIPPYHPAPPSLRVKKDEPLLAVIHGYGPAGWRDSQATQTYLLKNAVGDQLGAQSREEFLAANKGRRMPYLRGDLISQTLRGAPGFFYYTGATYAWYRAETPAQVTEPRLAEAGAPAQTGK